MARDSGNTVASGQIAFLKDEESAGGFFVCLPVYEKDKPVNDLENRRKNLKGFVLGVFKPSDMIESALQGLQPEGIDFGSVRSLGYDGHEVLSLSCVAASRGLRRSLDPKRLLDPKGVRYLVELGVAGHPWTIVCSPTAAFEAAHRTWWPSGVLAAGLLFTVMAAGYLLMNIGYCVALGREGPRADRG